MKTKIIVGLIGLVALTVQAESFYQSYVNSGTNSLSITNMGVNPVFVSSVTVKYVTPVTGTVAIVRSSGSIDQTLYSVALAGNTTFMLVKGDFAGVWLKKDDVLSISSLSVTNAIRVDTEESR